MLKRALLVIVLLVALVPMSGVAFAQAVEITVLAEDVPAGLNYDGPAAAIPTSQTGFQNLMEPLIYYTKGAVNDEGVQLFDFNSFEGRLAESWSFDEATLTWTFKLRQGVKGCGEATFNADDVLYTFARNKSVSGAAPIGWFLSNVASIKGFTVDVFDPDKGAEAKKQGDEIVKVDDYTVQIKQAAPNKLFLPVLTIFGLYIWDKETMEANATADDPWSHGYANNTNAPSFGAFCLERWVKDSEFVVTANANYYRGKAAIDRIVFRKVPQSANRVAAVQTGAAQLVERLTPREFDSLRKAAGVKVAGVFGNENLFIHMNFKTPPFDNVKFRQAVAYAIPYEDIIAAGYFGQARKWDGVIPSSYPGFHKSASQYTFDLDKAKALLAEAGYANGAGLEAFKDALRISYVAEKETTLGPIATIIQTALQDAGIPAELDPIPQTQYGDRQLVKKDLPLALNDQEKPIGVDAGYATLLFFVSTEAGGLNNMVNYNSKAVDEAFKALINEPDEAKRNAQLATVQDTLMSEVAWLPVVEYKTQWAFSDKLSGVAWYPDNSIRWYDLKLGQ
jgi:peptide/nickel transport system substrate-binding protein